MVRFWGRGVAARGCGCKGVWPQGIVAWPAGEGGKGQKILKHMLYIKMAEI